MFMHTFCKYVFVKSYADKFLKSYADKKENYTREKPSYVWLSGNCAFYLIRYTKVTPALMGIGRHPFTLASPGSYSSLSQLISCT